MSNPIRRALLSVSDKTGLVELGTFLANRGVEILSTGGTANALREAGVDVVEVSDHTGFPEIMDGRVKTLQPKIHGGLLAIRGNAEHRSAMAEHDIQPIDLLVVNLYPFEETVARGADFDVCIENIDIGGPAMIRAAAKNHDDVTVIVDPEDYQGAMEEMQANDGTTTPEFRKKMAAAAYARTGAYDAGISGWFNDQLRIPFPKRVVFGGALKQTLRYGENPHQLAAFYADGNMRPGVVTAEQIQGKELSFNNLNDTDAAFELVAEFTERPACVIVKHADPCGVAVGNTLLDAYGAARACDPSAPSAASSRSTGPWTWKRRKKSPKYSPGSDYRARDDHRSRRTIGPEKNLRVLITREMPDPTVPSMTLRSLSGGILLQGRDCAVTEELKAVTKREPTQQELGDLLFAFTVCKHVKSNGIVYARDGATVGLGAGQTSRVDSSRIAAWKAGEASESAKETDSRTVGSVVASDAFFPFADGLLAAAEAERDGGHSARRFGTRRRGYQGGQRRGLGHGLYRHAPLPPLIPLRRGSGRQWKPARHQENRGTVALPESAWNPNVRFAGLSTPYGPS